jgi:hypothetical protein
MTPIILVLALLFLPQARPPRNPAKSAASHPTLERRVIAIVQKLSAKALDPELPDQPFAEWFQSVVGKDAKVEWESNDCGEQTGDPKTTPADFPICGQASAKLPGARVVTVMVAVGSYKKGIVGAPGVFFVGIDVENTFEPVEKLHDLAAALSRSVAHE